MSLSSVLTERLSDTNSDGVADALGLSPTITFGKTVTYLVNARLVDSTGASVAQAGGDYELAAGSQPLKLRFNGSTIYGPKRSGPYRLVEIYVMLAKDEATLPELTVSDAGQTHAYDYRSFPGLTSRRIPRTRF